MARIVICEPSRELRHLFEVTIARLGHEPTVCVDARAGCPEADAMLVDVDDEGAADAAIRSRAHAAGMPVIVCSIYPRDERWNVLEPAAYLVKPFSRLELERAIGEALDARLGTIPVCPPTASATTATSA